MNPSVKLKKDDKTMHLHEICGRINVYINNVFSFSIPSIEGMLMQADLVSSGWKKI